MSSAAFSNPRGFEGVIHGATLGDLIQMECLAMTTRAVRIDRAGSFGRIYFAGGQIVHAEVGELRGEAALFALIAWPNGSFSIEEGVRSIDETITRDWHSLLIEAAQFEDEARANSAAQTASVTTIPVMQTFTHDSVQEVFADPEITAGIYYSEEGGLLESRCDNPDDLQATFAYVMQLASLVGESLGAENLHEIQTTGGDFKSLCAQRGAQTVAVFGTPKMNTAVLAKKLA